MIGHVRDALSTYGSDVITPIVLLPDMVYANLWALRHSYSYASVSFVRRVGFLRARARDVSLRSTEETPSLLLVSFFIGFGDGF